MTADMSVARTPIATPSAARGFPTLNGVRAVAALMVVGTHTAFNTGRILDGWTGAVLARFDFGVTLFFVLSGFLLSRPFLLASAESRPHPSWRHYLWKRALRVLPLYWAVVVAAMLLDPLNQDGSRADWISQLTLTQIYRGDFLGSSLTQMWSLCAEVAFYLLLPALCGLLTLGRPGLHLRSVLTRCLLIGALGLAWQASVAPIPGYRGHYAQWLPGYLPWFLSGVLMAAVSASLQARPRPHLLDRVATDLGGCWVAATAFFAIACSPIAGSRTLGTPGPWEGGLKAALYLAAGTLLVLPLVFGAEREGRVRTWLASNTMVWLGDISFGIFCVHVLVLNLAFPALGIEVFTGRFLTMLVVTLGVSITVAAISYRWFERPILRAKNLAVVSRWEPGGRGSAPR